MHPHQLRAQLTPHLQANTLLQHRLRVLAWTAQECLSELEACCAHNPFLTLAGHPSSMRHNTPSDFPAPEASLMEQWRACCDNDPLERERGWVLLEALSPEGWLHQRLDTLSGAQTPQHLQLWENTLLRIQRNLEPVGLGSRTLGEYWLRCLEAENAPPEVLAFLHQHRESPSHRLMERLSELPLMDRHITRLRTAPCDPHTPSEALLPDASVSFDASGTPTVLLMEDHLPHLCWQEPDAHHGADAQLRQEAQLMLRAWAHRRALLHALVAFLCAQQHHALRFGSPCQALSLTEVAEHLGCHPSTVSRALAHRTLATPRGLLPWRALVSRVACQDAQGHRISQSEVFACLKTFIHAESAQHPWSDAELSRLFHRLGWPLARRTVTKYRHWLNIPSTQQRKELVMHTDITGKQLDLTDALRNYVNERLKRLEHHYEKITRVHVILSVPTPHEHHAEATFHCVPHAEFFASAHAKDMYAAIDALVDKMDRQVRDHKSKLTDHRS